MTKLNRHTKQTGAGLLKVTTCLLLVATSSTTYAMKKCQDESGSWHYGDTAVIACENSKVTTLNDRGFIEEELAAPKTAQELADEAQAKTASDAEAGRLLAIENEKQRILSIYETEADIDRHRDNQLGSVDGNIAVHKAFLKSQEARIKRTEDKLGNTKHFKAKQRLTKDIESVKTRMQTYQAALEKLLVQKEEIMDRFMRDKALYQRLKSESS